MQSIKSIRPFKSYLFLLALIFFSPPPRLKLLIALLLILPTTYYLLPTSSHAVTPQKINYQGYVKNNGIPIDVATNFVFKICNDANCGGTFTCTETANGVPVVKGRFSHVIGTAGCDLATVPWATNTLYLQITVEGQVLTPSEEIVSAPYSLNNDYGTPETKFTLDRDNTGAGVNSRITFNRGTDNPNDAFLGWNETNDRFVLTSDGAAFADLWMGVASAATYFGDGSNLSNLPDAGSKVSKSGDTMTGPLLVDFNTATDSVKITNNTGTGLMVDGTGATAATASLYVRTDNTDPSGYAIRGDHTGAGSAVYGNNTAGGNGVYGNSAGTGRGVFGINNSNGSGVYGWNVGTGSGVFGVSDNAATGKAGFFFNSKAANTAAALTGETIGTAASSYGVYGVAAGAGTSLYAANAGATGNLIGGDHTGAGGNLIKLQSGGVDKFVVDKNGTITTGGASDNTKVAKAGDTMSGALGLSQGAATATVYAYQTNTTNEAGYFENTNAANTVAALSGVTAGTAASSYGVYGSAAGSGSGVLGQNTSTGSGVLGYNNSTGIGVFGYNDGAGGTGVFGENTSTGYGVLGTNGGAGYGVYGENTSTGYGVYGESTSATTGNAGYFWNSNAGNTAPPLSANTAGTGNLLELKKGGADKFVVDNNGQITLGGASDPTKVAKVGDTMTGPLLVNFNTATASLHITNTSGGNSLYINATGNTAATSSLYVNSNNTNAASIAVRGYTTGGGIAGSFEINNTGNTVAALSGVTAGVAATSYGVYGTAAGNGSGVYGYNEGTGYAIRGYNSGAGTAVFGSAAGVGSGVYGYNSSTGYGVYGYNNLTGYGVYGDNSNNTTGRAGYFSNSNAANTDAALSGVTLGTSATSYGVYGSAAGAGTSLYAANAGATGNLLGGDHTGAGGNLIKLQSSGVDKFVVDKNGVITTGSASDNTKVAKSGDTMTGPLLVNFNTATASMHITNASGGNSLYIDATGNTAATASLYVKTNNTNVSSSAIMADHSGAGVAGNFQINNVANGNNSVYVYTKGTGRAGYFDIDNPGNASAVLLGDTTGTGNLLQLQTGGVNSFVVDNTGNAYASGSVRLPLSGYLNFNTTLGNGGYGLRDNAGSVEFKDSAGSWTDLSGIGNAVQKSGDTMTGSLLINANTATESLKVSNNTGTGIMVDGTGGTAATASLYVTTNNTSGSSYAIRGDHSGSSTGVAVYGYNTGAGSAGYFQISNGSNTAHALQGRTNGSGNAVYGYTNGTGRAGLFEIGNAANANSAVFGYTIGTGYAGNFQINSATNNQPVVFGSTNGTGRAGYFQVNNTGSATDTVWLTTNSNQAGSSLLGGDHTGAGGNLIKLQSGGVDKFVVDKNGVITTGSASDNTKVAKAGDTMSGPLGIATGTATASLYVYQTGTTDEAGYFEITNAGNTVAALSGVTAGTAGTSYGVYGSATGSGVGVRGVVTGGSGYGVYGSNNSNGIGVYGWNNGTGYGVYGTNGGTGNGIIGISNSATTGRAGYFSNANAANTAAPLTANTSGTGNLLRLQKGAVDKFVVDNDGTITTGTASDGTKVLKTGDTMSGALGLSQSAATATVYAYQTNTTDEAGYFEITNAGSTNVSALSGKTAGTAIQSYGVYGEAAGGGIGVLGKNMGGTGYGVYGEVSGAGKAVYGWNDSTGDGVYGFGSSAGNTGYAVRGVSESNTTGAAGYFYNSNAANTAAALTGITVGTSASSYGVYGSAPSAGAGTSVYASNAGTTGNLYGGDHVGAGGNLIQLQSSGVDKFVVDKNGVITTGGASDNTKVAKSGDTMTGPLLVNFNTATASLHITNTGGGNSLYIDATGNTAATSSLYVKTNNTNVSSSAIMADHSGAGVAGNFQINNVANGNNSVYVYTKGTGRAGYFDIDNPSNSSAVLLGDTTGTGNLLQLQTGGVNTFVVANNGNVFATGSFVSDVFTPGQRAFVSNRGNVDGIYVQNPGTQGKAAQFLVTSGGNSNPTLTATNEGPGRAGFFQVNAPANATDTVFITTSSDNAASSLLGGNHSGADGVLVRLRSGASPGTERFVVDKTGNVFASGSVRLPLSGYLNFNTTLGSGGYGFRDNAGIVEYKNSAGSWAAFGGGGNFVAKTGDTMTGGLLVNFNTATESVKITNTTGTGLMVDGTGATAATSSLYVKTNNTNAASYAIRGDHTGNGDAVSGTNAGAGAGVFGTNAGAGAGVYGQNTGTGYAGQFFGNSTSDTVFIDNVGSAGYYLFLGCVGGANPTGVWGNCSSRKLKKDIVSLGRKGRAEMLDMVKGLDVVSYRYKVDDRKESVGLIAEDAPEILTGPGHNQILTGDAIGMLIAAMQSQQEQIESLKAEIERMKREK